MDATSRPCPCGGATYEACCGPWHRGEGQAPTAQALMRARYSAFALGLPDYLWATWHPRTRPENVDLGDDHWVGLTILDVVDGGEHDRDGIVEFEAAWTRGKRRGALHERSRFERRGGRWFYLDAVTPEC